MMAVSVTPNHHLASIVAAAFYGIWNLFSGFLIPHTWYYWICPVSWTLYGLVASQFGDITHVMEEEFVPVKDFIRDYYGFKHDFVGVCAVVVSGFAVLFALIFALAIKLFNFQRR
ncbi:ABC transporter G member 40 [Stylosanthes scabra]|uniref:ABC transporter G member 40 n=1 Tax=Stylosanthes scabra TaxID=79078 RepID=A0ABU6Q7A5_9FABA|nr:ABC transporter G member 40 [Stylosanthes scabra]